MGGWLALLVARALAESGEGARLAGLVLIAPAVDMTEKLIFERMTRKARTELDKNGVWMRASPYEAEPHPISREFIEEGRNHLLFGATIRSHCPVHILQGMRDEAAPWSPRPRARRAHAWRSRDPDADQGRRSQTVAAGGFWRG